MNDEEREIEIKRPKGKLSQAVIEFESIIYSIVIYIFCIPIYLLGYGYKALVFIAFAIPAVIVYLIEKVVLPIWYYLFETFNFILKYVVIVLEMLCVGFRAIYVFMRDSWRKINWCAVRSGIRILSIIGIIGAIYTIIEGVLQLPPDTVIITGKFFDANGTVFRIHEAIALLMISITAFYNAWAYSKEEEVTFICKNTVGLSVLRKIRDKIKGEE